MWEKFWKNFSHYYFKYFYFFLFLLLLMFPLHIYIIPLVIIQQFLNILFNPFHSFFSLVFSCESFYLQTCIDSDSLLALSSLLMSPSRAFFISDRVLLISSMTIWFFLIIYISLLPLSIYSCVVSTFSIRTLSKLIIIILNAPSDIYKIFAIFLILYHCGVYFFAF